MVASYRPQPEKFTGFMDNGNLKHDVLEYSTNAGDCTGVMDFSSVDERSEAYRYSVEQDT